jgi:hypothetical protein
MKITPEFFYKVETAFILWPSTLFLVLFFLPALIAFSPKSWLTFIAPFLWLGGVLGVVALWQMRESLRQMNAICIPKNTTIRYLWAKLLAGMASAILPILWIFSYPPDGGKRDYFLLFLCPVAVGAHWAWTLKNWAWALKSGNENSQS